MIMNPKIIKTILIVKPDALGDYILFTGALREIRNYFRTAIIALVCNKLAEPFCFTNPHIDHHIAGFERNLDSTLRMERVLGLLKQSPGYPYDLTMVFRWDTDSYFGGSLS